MPLSFGPEAFAPTASVTDDDLANLTGAVASKLRQVLTCPVGFVRTITAIWQGNYTNITRVRIVRDRQEVATFVRANSTAWDPEKVQRVSIPFTTTCQILVTTGAGPAIDFYIEYVDIPLRRR
jgi:hypothetical protein